MKKLLISILTFTAITSCEDVIDVNLPEVETRLVVDGLLRVDKSEEFVDVRITMRETSVFFDENQPTQVENAVINYSVLMIVDYLKVCPSLILSKKHRELGFMFQIQISHQINVFEPLQLSLVSFLFYRSPIKENDTSHKPNMLQQYQ